MDPLRFRFFGNRLSLRLYGDRGDIHRVDAFGGITGKHPPDPPCKTAFALPAFGRV